MTTLTISLVARLDMSGFSVPWASLFVLLTISTGTLLKPPPLHEPPSPEWWIIPIAEIMDFYAPQSSVNLVCVAHDCFDDTILRGINKSVTVWDIDFPNVTVPTGSKWDMFVVFVSYENGVLDFITRHDTSAKPLYLFVLPVDTSEEEVSAVFELCLARYILRAVAIVPKTTETPNEEDVGRSMWTYTYNPFVNNSNCSDTAPSLIFSWNITDDLQKAIQAIPERQVRNMQGCTVRAAARGSETNLVITPSATAGNWSFEGPWARVFFAILQGMNARLDLRKADEENFPDEHEEGDEVFFGRFSSNEERYKYFDFPAAARVQCYTYCVPRSLSRDRVWFLLVGEYTMEVWLLILVTMLAVAVLYKPMQRWKGKSFGFSLFYFFAAVNSSMYPNPKWDSARIVFALWSMFVLVMTTAYQAILQGFKTAPPQLDSIKDVGALLSSSLIIRGPPVLIKVMQNLLEDYEEGNKYVSKLIPYTEGVDIDEESLSEQYVHMCSSVEFITLNSRKRRHPDGHLRYYKIPNYCFLTQTERLVLLPLDSPFLTLVSDTILRLTEGGLLAHIMDVPEPFDSVTVRVTALGLSRLTSPLTLLGLGYAAAFVVFIAEVRGSMDWT